MNQKEHLNESIDLTHILKDCPKGTKFYSSIHGELLYSCMYLSSSASKITFIKPDSTSMVDSTTPITVNFYRDGRYYPNQGECTIFPSKDQRDWSKFTAPWYKPEKKDTKEKFDPKTLQPFDRVLGCLVDSYWKCDIFSNIIKTAYFPYKCTGDSYIRCIPYNDETKHLVGTTDAAPDFYRYWE